MLLVVTQVVFYGDGYSVERWNGLFLMAGCGGFCGALLPDKKGHSNSINEALKRGYAVISHDGGHQAPGFDTRWALMLRLSRSGHTKCCLWWWMPALHWPASFTVGHRIIDIIRDAQMAGDPARAA